MMRTLMVCLLCLGPSLCCGQDSLWTCKTTGYQMRVPDPGPASDQTIQAFIVFLPPKDNFASNINVQHQPFDKDMQEYKRISEEGLKKMKLNVIRSEIRDGNYICEAIGVPANAKTEMHLFFKAIQIKNNVILATVTIPTSRWETEKSSLVPLAESLTAIPGS